MSYNADCRNHNDLFHSVPYVDKKYSSLEPRASDCKTNIVEFNIKKYLGKHPIHRTSIEEVKMQKYLHIHICIHNCIYINTQLIEQLYLSCVCANKQITEQA